MTITGAIFLKGLTMEKMLLDAERKIKKGRIDEAFEIIDEVLKANNDQVTLAKISNRFGKVK